MARSPVSRRIWRFVDYRGLLDCWEWTGCRNWDGYGQVDNQRAHRAMYEILVGPIPDGLTIDHLCRNRACVNPAHLEPVTQRENSLRGNGVPARNARKTHCVHGHPFTPENVQLRPGTSHRLCIACEKIRGRRVRTRASRRKVRLPRTVCVHGHALDEENTRIDERGVRKCRVCLRESDRRRRLRKKAASV